MKVEITQVQLDAIKEAADLFDASLGGSEEDYHNAVKRIIKRIDCFLARNGFSRDYSIDIKVDHVVNAATEMYAALEKIIEMNRQHALDQYGNADKAEAWSCVVVARQALAKARGETNHPQT